MASLRRLLTAWVRLSLTDPLLVLKVFNITYVLNLLQISYGIVPVRLARIPERSHDGPR